MKKLIVFCLMVLTVSIANAQYDICRYDNGVIQPCVVYPTPNVLEQGDTLLIGRLITGTWFPQTGSGIFWYIDGQPPAIESEIFIVDTSHNGHGLAAAIPSISWYSTGILMNVMLPIVPLTVTTDVDYDSGIATITSSVSPGSVFYYEWTVPGGTNPGDVDSFTTSYPGTYDLLVTDLTNGAHGTSTIYVHPDSLLTTGVSNFAEEKFNLYPNPATEWIYTGTAETYTIVSQTGSTILLGEADRVNVSSLTPGIYFYVTKNSSIKFIKK